MQPFTIRTLAVLAAIASALAVAGSALGATRPDDRAGVRGPDTTIAATQVVAGDPASSARPDNRAGILGVGSSATESTLTVAASGGFNWTDAGIGAGAAAGLLVLLASGAMLAMPRRQHRRATA